MIVPGVIFVSAVSLLSDVWRGHRLSGFLALAKGFAGFALDRLGEFRIPVFFAGVRPHLRQYADHLRYLRSSLDQIGAIISGATAQRSASRPSSAVTIQNTDLSAAFPLLDRAGRDSAGYPVCGRHSQSSHSVSFGFEPQLWLGSNDWFRGTVITSGFWKNVGFSTIVYLAALDRHQPGLARSGCHRWRRTPPPDLAYYFAGHSSDDCTVGGFEFG